MSIFVSIASYRDPETIPTILDAYEKASNKHDIRFGVLLQESPGFSNKDKLSSAIKIDFLDYDWRDSQGACWARHNIQKLLYNNEDFYLQLDSHHRFCPNWDTELIDIFSDLEKKKHKPIVGGYCPGYKPTEDKNLEQKGMRIASFAEFTDLGDLMFVPKVIKNFEEMLKKNINVIRARFLSGHFIFANSQFVKDCIYDPNIYFRGEELSLSARAYTFGYDLFHPTKPIIWHEYLREDQIKHWNDHTKDNGFLKTSEERSSYGKQRVRHLLGMETNNTQFGKYGLGKVRPLHEYELYAGLNFAKKYVHKYAYDINDDAPHPYVMTENDWSTGMLKKTIAEFDLPSNYINNIIEQNADSLALIFYNEKDRVCYRKDIKKVNFKFYNTNTIKITGNMELKPHRVNLIPFLKTRQTLPITVIRSIRVSSNE